MYIKAYTSCLAFIIACCQVQLQQLAEFVLVKKILFQHFSVFYFSAPISATSELSQLPMATEVIVPSTQVKISEVDTTKYIHIRQNGTSARVFRETSV